MYISCSCSGPPHALYVCGFRSCCSYKFISLHWTCACTSCLQVHLLALCLRMQSMYASSSPWTMPTHTVCATMQLGRRYCCHREDQVSKDSTTHLDLAKLKESLFAQSAKRQDNKTFYRSRASAATIILLAQAKSISQCTTTQWLIFFHCQKYLRESGM